MFGIGCLFFSFDVGRSMFDVRRSSFKTTPYGINVTCECLQNNLALMGNQGSYPYLSRRLSENGYFSQSLRQTQIIILEILQCIPVVVIFAFLDLGKNISFSDSLLG